MRAIRETPTVATNCMNVVYHESVMCNYVLAPYVTFDICFDLGHFSQNWPCPTSSVMPTFWWFVGKMKYIHTSYLHRAARDSTNE